MSVSCTIPRATAKCACAHAWKAALEHAAPELRVRRNYPYAGIDDGFMPYLRTRFRPHAYVGIEIEINQAIVIGARPRWAGLRSAIIDSLRVALAR